MKVIKSFHEDRFAISLHSTKRLNKEIFRIPNWHSQRWMFQQWETELKLSIYSDSCEKREEE